MVKKIISGILILLGLGVLGLGIGSGTIWKPEETVTLKTGGLDKALLAATNPGVVHQVNEQFKMTVTAPDGGDVVVVSGRALDVEGWIGNDAHWLVTGASSWDGLDTEFVAEKAEPVDEDAEDPDAAPQDADPAAEDQEPVSDIASLPDSDMWYEVTESKGTVTVELEKVPDNVVFLAGSLDPAATEAPEIAITWDRVVPTPLIVPGILAGALLMAIGVLILIDSLRHGSDPELEAQAAADPELVGSGSDSSPSGLTALGTEDRSELEDAAAFQDAVAIQDAAMIQDAGQSEPDQSPLGVPMSAFAPKAGADLDAEAAVGLEADTGLEPEADPDLDGAQRDPSAPEVDTDLTAFAPKSSSEHGTQSGPDSTDLDSDDLDSAGPASTDLDSAGLDTDDLTDDESAHPVRFTPVVATAAESDEEVASTDSAVDGAGSQKAESWFKRMFGKTSKPQVTPAVDESADPPASASDSVPEMTIVPEHTEPTEAERATQDRATQIALEAFAEMEETDVTTGALQAVGLTRRQLREMRERKEQNGQHNIPTTTGSMDFGEQAPAPLAPERPSWLPQGTDSTSASSWRAAWGVRSSGTETDTAAAPQVNRPEAAQPGTAKPDTSKPSAAQPAPGGSDPAKSDTSKPHAAWSAAVAPEAPADNSVPVPTQTPDGVETAVPDLPAQDQVPATPASDEPKPTTRRALYSAYRAAAERIANEEADEEQKK